MGVGISTGMFGFVDVSVEVGNERRSRRDRRNRAESWEGRRRSLLEGRRLRRGAEQRTSASPSVACASASPSTAIATPRRSALSTARTRLVVSSSIAAAGSPSVVAISPRQASENTAPSTDPVASKRANASRWYEFAAARSPATRAASPMPLNA